VILGLALMIGLAVAWALGADLSRTSAVQFRAAWLVFLALLLQIVIFTPLATPLPPGMHVPIHVATYVLLAVFLLINLRIPGWWMAGIGMLANLAVIVANGGLMPVSAAAWRATGASLAEITSTGSFNNNVLAGRHTHLGFLGDNFAFPAIVPFASAISVGDVLIVFGMVAFVYRTCTDRMDARATTVIAPLRYPRFRHIIAGRITSKLGDWLSQAAAITWIYATTHSTPAVSAVLLARMLGATLGGAITAPIIDRVSGFRLLSTVELLRGATALLMIPFALSGQIWPVIALAGVSSLLASSTAASASSLIPDVLPADLLHAGNALHGVARNITLVIGALAGGFLVIHFGITTALVADIMSFVAAAAVYWRYSARSEQRSQHVSRRVIGRAMLRNRVVVGLTASFTVVSAATGLLNASLPATFDRQLGDAHAYGYALAMLGIGLLCGELLTGLIQRESVARRSVSLAFLGLAAAVIIIAHSHVQATILLMVLLLGASDGTTEIVYDTLIQRHSPRGILGGVFAIASSVQIGGMMIGLAAAPLLLDHTSVPTVLSTAAGTCLVGAAIAAAALAHRPDHTPSLRTIAAPSIRTSTDRRPLVLAALGTPAHPDRHAMISQLERSLPALGAALRLVPTGHADPRLGAFRHGGIWVIDEQQVVRFAFTADHANHWIPATFITARLQRLTAGLGASPDRINSRSV
jgi:predicted MFS family arabinose efflux permease